MQQYIATCKWLILLKTEKGCKKDHFCNHTFVLEHSKEHNIFGYWEWWQKNCALRLSFLTLSFNPVTGPTSYKQKPENVH